MTAHSPLRLHWLDPRNPRESFPDVDQALRDPNGLLAIGGDLSVARLLQAYRKGIFPWFNPDEPILWWSPDPRAVFYPDAVRVHRSLRQSLRRADYAVTLDRAFPQVIDACGQGRHGGTWLGGAMQHAYLELFRRGYAHSVEVWREGALIGGLYGVSLGRVFFGESMFSRASDASKIALVWLSRQLEAWGFELIDCQIGSPHLDRLGAQYLPRQEFKSLLNSAIDGPLETSGSWHFDIPLPPSAQHGPGPHD